MIIAPAQNACPVGLARSACEPAVNRRALVVYASQPLEIFRVRFRPDSTWRGYQSAVHRWQLPAKAAELQPISNDLERPAQMLDERIHQR
jgi:hypothetical protein